MYCDTISESIGYLTVYNGHIRVVGFHPRPFAIMYNNIFQRKSGSKLIISSGIAYHTIFGTVNIRIWNVVARRGRMYTYATPLSAHTVVRQIIKHSVCAISPENYIVTDIALVYNKPAIYIYSGSVMKIKTCRSIYSKCSTTIDRKPTADDNRLVSGYDTVFFYHNGITQ